ncbi:hypothetical protein KQI84_19435, partial [bacterium]|nr:hypothetical protein [bacterium]
PTSLPSWLVPRRPGPIQVTAGRSRDLHFDILAGAPGLLVASPIFQTNDPLQPELAFVLAVEATADPVAPVVLALASDPVVSRGGIVAPQGVMRFTVQEATGRNGLSGEILVSRLEDGVEIARVDLAPGEAAGEYRAAWNVPPEALRIGLGAEATLRDADSGMQSSGGSDPLAADLQFTLLDRNTAPQITEPADFNETLWATQPLEVPFAAVDLEGDPVRWTVEHSPLLDVTLDEASGILRIQYIGGYASEPQFVSLGATDSWGAADSLTLEFPAVFFPPWPYSSLVGYEDIELDQNPLPLTALAGSTSEKPQRLEVDYRPQGTETWTRYGDFSFNRIDPTYGLWVSDFSWNWPDDGTVAFELQLTLIDNTGTPETSPSCYLFEVPRFGGAVIGIEVPGLVYAGSDQEILVHVRNDSNLPWTKDDGFAFRPVDPVDPLTRFTAGEWGGMDMVERGRDGMIRLSARMPDTPGSYRTAWQLWREGTGVFGESAETWVQVNPQPGGDGGVALFLDCLLGRSDPSASAISLDRNTDGMVDASDLRALLAEREIVP